MISVLILLLYAYTIQGIGYDAGGGDRTSCGRPFRTGRIYKPSCDLTTFGYCSQAGELYPWRAVKRFVKDNQGLMRRMYGDQRHGHVLRTELEEDIDDDENEASSSSSVDDHQMRWKPTSIRFARYQQNNDEDLNNDNNMLEDIELDDDNEDDVGDDEPRYLKDNDDVLNTKFVISEKEAAIAFKLAELKAAAHFRPSHRTQFSTQRIPTTRPQKISLSPVKSASSASSSSKNITKLIPTISKKGSPISNNYVRFESNNEIGANEHRTTTWKTTTKTDEKYYALDIITEESTLITTEDSLEHSTYTDDITTEINPQNASTSTSASTTKKIVTTTLQQENLFNLTSSSSEDAESTKNVETVADDDDDDDTKHTDAPKTPGAMLFQDMEEDSVKLTNNNAEINFKNKKGINACPVKEEVVAPFWANNTRGEVLALLNMYPFEQYVHWEKCTSEFKQMYCRKGCRCEQQYRLHRLLAYDPNNECRGIFSDWFKFPSCCICKCYDIPLDFRVTSRSPRFEMNYPGEDEQEANNYNNA